MTDHPLTASVRRCSQTTTHHVIISCCHGPPDESLWQAALEWNISAAFEFSPGQQHTL